SNGAFTLGGIAPTEFAVLRSVSGGQSTLNYYWAEWQGLTAVNSYQVQISGVESGQHTSFAGASAAYFNTNSAAYDITAVPEPSSAGVLALIGAFAGALRRRRQP